MELYNRIIESIDTNLFYCLIPILITLFVIQLLFKNKFETKKALNIVRWFILFYGVLSILNLLFELITSDMYYSFINRATGPYLIMYWVMLISNFVLPFTLCIKKLGKNYLYIIGVVFLMKIGLFFERFIIIITTIHQDQLTFDSNLEKFTPLVSLFKVLFLQGFIISIGMLGIFEVLKRKN